MINVDSVNPDWPGAINRFLDTLPRAELFRGARAVPAFKACGVCGFYTVVLVMFASGLWAGRSLAVLSALAAVCACSFFAYTYLRRLLTGYENLVLLEHVWVALVCSEARACGSWI